MATSPIFKTAARVFFTSRRKLSSDICQFESVIDIPLFNGRCIGVQLPLHFSSSGHPELTLDEIELANKLTNDAHKIRFIGGRIALRRSMNAPTSSIGSILRGEGGEPLMPSKDCIGSISHKDHIAVGFSKQIVSTRRDEAELAAAASSNNELNKTVMTENIGVDVEVLGENKYRKDRTSKFLKRIMTPKEYALTMESSLAASLEELSDYALFHFSMKEAVFKAMFPFVRTHISWKEVELLPSNHDRSSCEVLLQGHRFVGNHGYRIRGQWWREGNYVISGVSATKSVGHEELKGRETSVSCAAP
jgi:phosphopantetheine--protein transferase-like protein